MKRVVDADVEIRPFHIDVAEGALADLRRRIAATQWPERETVSDESQGVPLATMQKLARYWETESSMRSVLSFLDAPQLNAPEAYITFDADVFSDDGEVRNEATADFLRHFMEEYDAFVHRVLSVTAPGHIGDKLPEIRR